MAKQLTSTQKNVMAQVKALAEGQYLQVPLRLTNTVKALFAKALVSYHNDDSSLVVVPAGRFSYGAANGTMVAYQA